MTLENEAMASSEEEKKVKVSADRRDPVTGIAGSDGERRAANRLADALRERGRSVAVEAASVRIAEGASLSLHALLAVGGGLLAIYSPLAGAALCLVAAFSFYSERALGSPLLGRLMPTRATQNVISPPPGPAWNEVEVVLTAGYDLGRSYPVGELLSRRFSGRLTTDRIVFWGGLVPVFLATMLYVAAIEGAAPQIVQLVGSTLLLAMVAAQFDARITGSAEAGSEDLQATRDLLATLDELLEQPGSDPPVAVCFFGAESQSAGGAAGFFGRRRSVVTGSPAVISFVRGRRGGSALDRSPILLTAREGDLTTLRMSFDLGAGSPLKPEAAILRRTTTALIARRRGLRATTVVGRGDKASGLALDLVERAFEEEDTESG